MVYGQFIAILFYEVFYLYHFFHSSLKYTDLKPVWKTRTGYPIKIKGRNACHSIPAYFLMTLLKKHLPESFLSQTWLSTVPPWNGRKPLLWYSNDTFTILDERTFLNVNKLWIFSSFVAIFYKFYILSPGLLYIFTQFSQTTHKQ